MGLMQPSPWITILPFQISSYGLICLFFPMDFRITSSSSVLIQPKYKFLPGEKQAIFKHLKNGVKIKIQKPKI